MYPDEPLRLCDRKNGCQAPPHYENCPDCFGFGRYPYLSKDERSIQYAPVTAGMATGSQALYETAKELEACPTCKSTIEGAPSVIPVGPLDAGDVIDLMVLLKRSLAQDKKEKGT